MIGCSVEPVPGWLDVDAGGREPWWLRCWLGRGEAAAQARNGSYQGYPRNQLAMHLQSPSTQRQWIHCSAEHAVLKLASPAVADAPGTHSRPATCANAEVSSARVQALASERLSMGGSLR